MPLSRDRTPVPHDLHDLHESACAAGDAPNVEFLVLVRRACATSSRLVATFLASMLMAQREAAADVIERQRPDSDSLQGHSPTKRARLGDEGVENKGIMNLCRCAAASADQ